MAASRMRGGCCPLSRPALPVIAQPSPDLQTLLYVSDAAPNLPPGSVEALTHRARERNRLDEISGLLVFDGLRFAQLVEGPASRMGELLERLMHDPRHTNVQILAREPLPARRFADWQLGYLMLEPATANLGALASKSGEAAIRAFTAFLPRLHIDRVAAPPATPASAAPRGHVPQ